MRKGYAGQGQKTRPDPMPDVTPCLMQFLPEDNVVTVEILNTEFPAAMGLLAQLIIDSCVQLPANTHPALESAATVSFADTTNKDVSFWRVL